ncbi:YceI family protein [Crocinitomix algicola]|uniref:YceI family protein n=1 Tax=Crocinitomix algicola TaxID=1740263 RepID=UPI00087268FA|nr:YceI family protein [Crocinitomix algicola]
MKTLFTFFLGFSLFSVPNSYTVKTDAVKITFLADMQKTEGSIGGFEAKIKFDSNNLMNSNIEGSVDVSTLKTGVKKRDEHLKSSDFFDVEKFPKMTFKSTNIQKEGGLFVVYGTMKIKETERKEKITFRFENNIFTAETIIQAANYKFGYEKKKPEKTDVKINFLIPVH